MAIEIPDILKQAIKDNKDEIVLYILGLAEIYAQTAFRYAAERGKLSLMKAIHKNPKYLFTSVDMPRQAFVLAIQNNHLDVLKYLIDENIYNRYDLQYSYYSGLPTAVYNAAKYPENRPILDYLLSLKETCITPDALVAAAAGESQEIIDLLVHHGADNRISTIESYYKQRRGRLSEKDIHARNMAKKYLL